MARLEPSSPFASHRVPVFVSGVDEVPWMPRNVPEGPICRFRSQRVTVYAVGPRRRTEKWKGQEMEQDVEASQGSVTCLMGDLVQGPGGGGVSPWPKSWGVMRHDGAACLKHESRTALGHEMLRMGDTLYADWILRRGSPMSRQEPIALEWKRSRWIHWIVCGLWESIG